MSSNGLMWVQHHCHHSRFIAIHQAHQDYNDYHYNFHRHLIKIVHEVKDCSNIWFPGFPSGAWQILCAWAAHRLQRNYLTSKVSLSFAKKNFLLTSSIIINIIEAVYLKTLSFPKKTMKGCVGYTTRCPWIRSFLFQVELLLECIKSWCR